MPFKDDPVRRLAVDSLLIEHHMQASLDDLYLCADDETELTLLDMEQKRLQAYRNKDFEMIARLERDIKDLKLGVKPREECDLEYETRKFEEMVVFGNQTAIEVKEELYNQQV